MLVRARPTPESVCRRRSDHCRDEVRRLRRVVLAYTELPMIADAVDFPLPCLDSTRLLAKAALREALSTM
jgi:aspartate racemase